MTFSTIKKIALSTSIVAGMALASTTATAQVTIPGTAEIGRAGSSIERPDFGGVSGPTINIPEVHVEDAPDGADRIKLTLNEIILEGVSAYDVAELQQLWADKIGQTISLTDVYAIAQTITRKYRGDGFIITQAIIPQQTIDNGIVTIRVVEGFIDQVSLDGAENTFASERILMLAENLTKVSPLTAEDLEKWLLLVNDLPGFSARSIISPSATTLGGADLVIVPSFDPYNFSFNFDNFGSRFLGQTQFSAAAQFNNLFNAAESLETQFVTDAEDDELVYWYGRLNLPVNSYGSVFGMDFTYSDTNPGFELDIFEVNGYSKLFGFDITHPFIRTRTQNLFGSLRFDYRDLTSENIVDSFKTKDKIAALRAGFDYSLFDNLWRPAVNEFSFTLSQGIPVFDANETGDANMTRANGDPQFTKIEAAINRLQSITSEWSLLTSVSGQLSNNPLLSSEEFGVGGRTLGRGYDSSELVGDDGFAASLELRWKPGIETDLMKDYEIFTFYDFGKIWNQEETVSNTKTESLASIGLGLRADFTDIISGEFVAAQPLTKDVDVYDNKNAKFFFSLGADF